MATHAPLNLEDHPRTDQMLQRSSLSPRSQSQSEVSKEEELPPQSEPEIGEETAPGDPAEGEREKTAGSASPSPDEEIPPLPNEAPPGRVEDDGWEPIWDGNAQAYYFYNRFTGVSQWENPRVPGVPQRGPADEVGDLTATTAPASRPVAGGYNPAIHGDYDPTAPYAKQYELQASQPPSGHHGSSSSGSGSNYDATGVFNRFTGKWQPSWLTPENFNDENKARRQLSAFFDVDAAANSHDGRSLKAERSGKKLTKKELKAFKEKRRERKEEKRRAWLRD